MVRLRCGGQRAYDPVTVAMNMGYNTDSDIPPFFSTVVDYILGGWSCGVACFVRLYLLYYTMSLGLIIVWGSRAWVQHADEVCTSVDVYLPAFRCNIFARGSDESLFCTTMRVQIMVAHDPSNS